MNRFQITVTIYCVILLWILAAGYSADSSAVDRRSYQHGIRFIADANKNYWLLWSSSPGNPPQGEKRVILHDGTRCSYFTHDIYTSPITLDHLKIEPRLLLALPEAQEPVDAAVAMDGSVALTYEDGSESDADKCDGVIKQRVKIFSQFPQKSFNTQTVRVSGAHSGHITAIGNDFIVVYAEGWIDGGGVSQAGTANDIYVDVFSTNGESKKHKAIAVDKGLLRDWWPLVAGSSRFALIVWQRYVDNSNHARLMMTIYDPVTNSLVKPVTELREGLQYYHYDVQYLASINRFLIVGNSLAKVPVSNSLTIVTPRLFAYLLDESGNIVDQWENEELCKVCGSYPSVNLVREARPAVISKQRKGEQVANVYYPVKPHGVVSLQISRDKVWMNNIFELDQFWFPLGTDGVMIDSDNILFASLTPAGVKLIEVFVGQDYRR